MKTLGCTQTLRMVISSVSHDGESVDNTINRLLDVVESDMSSGSVGRNRTNINIKDETYDRLDSLKSKDNESLTHVIQRAIQAYNNKGVDE